MTTETDNQLEDDTAPSAAKPRPAQGDQTQPRPQKASYESNEDVQRWLKEQALEDGGLKPKFNPTFLALQRDAPWILSSLAHFYENDLITDVLAAVKSGKEATVFCCQADPATGYEYLAAKVYRPRMFRSLRNDAIYRQSREWRDEQGRALNERRRRRASSKKTGRWKSQQVSSWIEYEFETQRLLYEAGADVPKPLAQIGNAVLMEYIGGDDGEPAPLLRETRLDQAEAQPLFEQVLRNIELWLAYDRIHGDLSEYNMLYWQGAITIIDFAQAVDPRQNPAVYPLLARDIERVCRCFARYGVASDPTALADDLWTRYEGGEL
jgi:RIO kinase 1